MVVNNRYNLKFGEYKDHLFQKEQLDKLYSKTGSSTKRDTSISEKGGGNQFGINLSSNPKNYQISKKRTSRESASYVRLQLEYLHL